MYTLQLEPRQPEAGDAVLYDNAVLRSAGGNTSERSLHRVCFICIRSYRLAL